MTGSTEVLVIRAPMERTTGMALGKKGGFIHRRYFMKKHKNVMVTLLVLGMVVCFFSAVSAGEVASSPMTKINVNKASLEDLSGLKRIGPKYAQRLIEYRKDHGPFKKVEDIMNVPGIGPRTLEANRDILTVD
jgi:competence protein ComEA